MIASVLATILLANTASQVSPTIGTPRDATELAFNDASQFPDPSNLRYIWISGKLSKELMDEAKIIFFELNLISDSQILFKPTVLVSDKVMIIRIDLNSMVKDKKGLVELMDVWESFRFDPKFSGLITKGSLKLSKTNPEGVSRRVVTHPSGSQRIVIEESAKTALDRDSVLRFIPSHVGPKWNQLANLLQTEAPVVEYKYFTYRSMLAIQEDGLYKSVYGGLYYKLAQIPTSKDQKKQTDLDALLESLGVGGRGKTAKQIFEELRSDLRTAMFKSGVTDRLRVVEVHPILTGRGFASWFRITSDIAKGGIDVNDSPIANLLEGVIPKAREAIWTRANGMPGFVLFNGDGKIQDSAPDNTVRDGRSRPPQLSVIEPCFTCLRCHSVNDNWQDTANDVKKMMDAKKVDIFGDLSRKNNQDAINRIAGLYLADFSKIARNSRNDYVLSIYTIVGPWTDSKDQTNLAKVMANRMDDIMQGYYHTAVSPKAALEEMGYEVNEKEAADFLARQMLKLGNDPVLIDSRVAGLISDISINRYEWDTLYGMIMR